MLRQKKMERICEACRFHLQIKISGVVPKIIFEYLHSALVHLHSIRSIRTSINQARELLITQMRASENPHCTVHVQIGRVRRELSMNQLEDHARSEWTHPIMWFILCPPSTNQTAWTKRILLITPDSQIVITSPLYDDIPIDAYLCEGHPANGPTQNLRITNVIRVKNIEFHEKTDVVLPNGQKSVGIHIDYVDDAQTLDLTFVPFTVVPTHDDDIQKKSSVRSLDEQISIEELESLKAALSDKISNESVPSEIVLPIVNMDTEVEIEEPRAPSSPETRTRSGHFTPVVFTRTSIEYAVRKMKSHYRPPPSPLIVKDKRGSSLLYCEDAPDTEECTVQETTHALASERILCDTDYDRLRLDTTEEADFLRETIDSHRHMYFKRSLAQRRKMHAIMVAMGTHVDWEQSEHEAQLRLIWNFFFESNEFQRKSPLWSEIGFQGRDPCTDFRGMGTHALSCLLFLIEKESDFCRYVVNKEVADDSYYPLAVSWINLASMICKLLDVQHADALAPEEQKPLFQLFCQEPEDSEPFYELFRLLVTRFDAVWLATQSGYMDFPNVMNAFKTRMEDFLSKKPHSFETFLHWIATDNYVEEYKTWSDFVVVPMAKS